MALPDVVVVGGGIVGAAIAYELAKDGARVTLVERADVGRQASWAAGGLLTPVHLAEYPGPLASLCVAGVPLFAPLVAELRKHSSEQVDLKQMGMLYVVRTDADQRDADLLEAWKRERGMPVERIDGPEARRREPVLAADLRGAVFIPDVLQLRNHRFTRALAQAAEALGAVIHRNREVTGFLRVPGRVNGVKTTRGDLKAAVTIVAAGAWAGDLLAPIGVHIPVKPIRGQMLLLDAPADGVRNVILAHDHYLIPRGDGKVLLGSTAEDAGFDCRVTVDGASFLLSRLRETAPDATGFSLAGSWAGLRPGSPDRLPFLGKPDGMEGLLLACGHFRNGILLAPITAKIIAALVAGKTPPVDLAPFAVHRTIASV
jgi:glycine oxidase